MENKQDLKQLLKGSGYSEKAIKYYLEKTHIGRIEHPDAEIMHMGLCGDIMHFSLRIKNDIIENIKFQATCCVGGLSAGSAVSMLVKGKTIKQAKSLTEEDIARHLMALPKQKIHCICLAVKALKKAIENYEKRLNGE